MRSALIHWAVLNVNVPEVILWVVSAIALVNNEIYLLGNKEKIFRYTPGPVGELIPMSSLAAEILIYLS